MCAHRQTGTHTQITQGNLSQKEYYREVSGRLWGGRKGLVHWEDPEGSGGEGGGRGDRDGEYM